MNTQPTLFSRYKRMINLLLEDGQSKYTANELNTFVGQFENPTLWKRWNNNPYYTTRTYQTILSDFGCITKIKRGLWQINGPIPEWFGSFHFTGLKRGYDADNKYADHNCQYWKSLPDAHRLNPWKIAPLQTNNTLKTDNMTNTENTQTTHFYTDSIDTVNVDESKTTIDTGMVFTSVHFTVTAPVGIILDCRVSVNIYPTTVSIWGVDLVETELFMQTNKKADFKAIKNVLDTLMGEDAAGKWLKELDKYGKTKALEAFPNGPNSKVAETAVVEGTYTKSQVEQILKAFMVHIVKDVESAIENECESLDEGDVVDIDFDNYDRKITVDLNIGSIASQLSRAASDQIDMSYDDFDIETVEIK
jgi:hypothetical protein